MRADRPTPVAPQVISRDRQDLSPWVTLETISVARDAAVDVYHAFGQADYVQVLTMTAEGMFVLVQQYRPVVARRTIEFPGGLRDPGRAPKPRLRASSGRKPAMMLLRWCRSSSVTQMSGVCAIGFLASLP